MKTIEIAQSGNVLVLSESEPAQVTFRPGTLWKEISLESPYIEIIDLKTADSNRGVGVSALYCIVRNHTSAHHETPIAWFGEKADWLQVIGGYHQFCATPFYGMAGSGRGANHVKVTGIVAEDVRSTGGDSGPSVQNGSYCSYEITVRRGSGFVAYQKFGQPMQYNTFIFTGEDIEGRIFDFGGDGTIQDGLLHQGNKLYVTAKNCQGGLRLKARHSNNPWRIKGVFENCPNYIEWLGMHYVANIEIRK